MLIPLWRAAALFPLWRLVLGCGASLDGNTVLLLLLLLPAVTLIGPRSLREFALLRWYGC